MPNQITGKNFLYLEYCINFLIPLNKLYSHYCVYIHTIIYCHFRCQLPGEDANASYFLPPEVLNVSYPWEQTFNRYSNCSYQENSIVKDCDAFIFDKTVYESSTVIQVFNIFFVFFKNYVVIHSIVSL